MGVELIEKYPAIVNDVCNKRKERSMTVSTRKWTTDRIYDNLRQGIMTLELYPGSRVTETELAQRFGVSRTPVREALQRLAVEGYLTIRPKHGCYIRQLDVFELAEYYDVRVGLELEGVALTSQRVPYRELAQLAEADVRFRRNGMFQGCRRGFSYPARQPQRQYGAGAVPEGCE